LIGDDRLIRIGTLARDDDSSIAFSSLAHTYLLDLRPMKSAYELAMERLEKQSPTRQLTEVQKSAIAEIEAAAKAKIAEQELFLKDKIAEATAEGKYEEAMQLEQQLTHEIRRANEDAESRKEKVRSGP
jgi:hypothetical protein